MFFRYKKTLQTIAFLLVTCLANGSVFAALPDEIPPSGTNQRKSFGILSTSGEGSVLVNGNIAYYGMTILSNVEIRTGKKSGAMIDLRQSGMVELCSETTVRLVFTDERVDLHLLNGQAKLTTFKGISGILIGADGKALETDSSLKSSSVGNCETTSVDVSSPATTGLFGSGAWGTLAIFGGIMGGSALVWFAASANNTSEGTVSRVRP